MTQQTINLNDLSQGELLKIAEGLQSLEDQRKYNKQSFLFPESEREAYKKHWQFMDAGKFYNERALVAGNRTGKTWTACSELSYHMNGRYPKGWKGKKFDHPVNAWSVGKTHETTRDILQKYMLGPRHDLGSGFIPRDDMTWDGKVHVTSKSGIPDAIQDAYCKHYTAGIFDGYSHLQFKSYIQGVDAFMGDQVDVAHCDEEPASTKMYGEILMRTMTTNGIIMCTFTPLEGLSEVVLSFLPNGKFPEGGCGPVHSD